MYKTAVMSSGIILAQRFVLLVLTTVKPAVTQLDVLLVWLVTIDLTLPEQLLVLKTVEMDYTAIRILGNVLRVMLLVKLALEDLLQNVLHVKMVISSPPNFLPNVLLIVLRMNIMITRQHNVNLVVLVVLIVLLRLLAMLVKVLIMNI